VSSRRRGRGHGGGAPATGPAVAAAAVPGPIVEEAAALAPVEPAGAALNGNGAIHQSSEPRAPRIALPPRPPRQGQGSPNNGSGRSTVPPVDGVDAAQAGQLGQVGQQPKSGATLAQMRRFIKSRPYVPVHELRRRFLIEGIEDEVNPLSTGNGTLYVGLPPQEAGFLGDLVRNGEVGCELLLDPPSPGVIGVFPMRPVARQ
jgi:hypothetical protein